MEAPIPGALDGAVFRHQWRPTEFSPAKTRMWGVWFEDWNHYPFFFDGPRTIVHFEKTFVPNGVALFYFLEPAAADLCSPVEIVQQALGIEKSAALFDFDANQLRKLKYSTPNEFMYDRPVCATTTRLSKIKKVEKPTVGINLATHLSATSEPLPEGAVGMPSGQPATAAPAATPAKGG